MRRLILFVLSCLMLSFKSSAQFRIKGNWPSSDTSRVHILTLKEGDVFVGKLLKYNSNEVVFKMNMGDTLVYKPDEVKMVKISPSETAPIHERLLISPTGLPSKKEKMNIAISYLSTTPTIVE